MRSFRSTVTTMCFVALMCVSASRAATINDGLKRSPTLPVLIPLRSAAGKLEHVFSVPFEADPVTLSKISGLESLTFARTSADGGINIVLDHGVPHPTKVISVEIVKDVGANADQMLDPFQPPAGMPSRSGHRLISTFRVPGKNSYLATWLDVRSGEGGLTVWDEDNQAGQLILVAMSSSRILGAAVQFSMHGIPDLAIDVWTKGRTECDVIVGMYRWNIS